MAAIAVFQDQENVIQEQGTLSKGQTSMFHQTSVIH